MLPMASISGVSPHGGGVEEVSALQAQGMRQYGGLIPRTTRRTPASSAECPSVISDPLLIARGTISWQVDRAVEHAETNYSDAANEVRQELQQHHATVTQVGEPARPLAATNAHCRQHL